MNIRLTILMVIVVVLAGGAWAIIEFTDLVSRDEARDDEPWLYHIDEDTIASIEVTYDDDTVKFARDPAGYQWMLLGDPDFPVFQQRWGGMPLLFSGPRVNRGLKRTIDNPAVYGLDPPETIARVSDLAGNTFEFHMGSPTPDGENQYARLVGDNALYTVPSVWADVVNRLAAEPPYGRLFDLELQFIRVVEVNAGESSSIYFLEGDQWHVGEGPPPIDPATTPLVSNEWYDWLVTLSAPRVDEIVEQDLNDRDEEKLEMYGMLEPPVRIVIARRGQATVEIHLAEGPPGSNSYYARSINSSDSKLYTIKKSRLAGIEELASNPLAQPGWQAPGETEQQN